MGSAARDQVPLLPLAPGVYRFRDEAGRVPTWDGPPPCAGASPRTGATSAAAPTCAVWWRASPGWRRSPAVPSTRPPGWSATCCRPAFPRRTATPRAARSPRSAPSATARYFGPYLGGRQVRLAVSGLARVFPLNYAGLDIVGTERDLARIHGVSADDRPALVAALAAVLDREPAAVAAVTRRLAERRGAAAETLAFEVAARLQEEIEAIEWVTAPQRVTSATAADHDVCGWSDGLPVRFAVRGGRLTGWTQRACSAASARRHLTATAPHWQEFAQRNADLAARLNQPAADA